MYMIVKCICLVFILVFWHITPKLLGLSEMGGTLLYANEVSNGGSQVCLGQHLGFSPGETKAEGLL